MSTIALAIWLVAVIAASVWGSQRPLRIAARSSILLLAALVFGAPANLLFVAGLRYHAYIPGDPVVDWLPFFPSGAWLIDQAFGGRFISGGSPELLHRAWVALAVPVWACAFFVERRTARFLRLGNNVGSRAG